MPETVVAAPVAGGRRARGAQTRSLLLGAARTAFSAVGWQRCRVEDICRAAGIAHGTFYGHFANKSAVVEALVRAHAAELNTLLETDWSSDDPRDAVRRVIDGFVALSERDADVRATWLQAAPAEPTLSALVDEVRGQFVERIRASLAAAVEAGHARADLDVAVAAGALAAMVEQHVALSVRGEPPVTRERLVDGLTDLWIHAVYRT